MNKITIEDLQKEYKDKLKKMNEYRRFFHIDYLNHESIQQVAFTDFFWGNDRVTWGLHLTEYEFNLLKEKGHLVLDSGDRSVNVQVAKTILAQLIAKETEEVDES